MTCDIRLEQLSALLAGELDVTQTQVLRQHIERCPACATLAARLQDIDQQFRSAVDQPVPPEAARRARQAMHAAVQRQPTPEIMTLDEVGQCLRLTPSQLAQILEQLPSFSVAGEVRIRRDRLMQWVKDQEQQAFRDRVRSQAARSIRMAFEQGIAS